MGFEASNAIRGMAEAMKQAEAGMMLFKNEGPVQTDLNAADVFKTEREKKMAEMQKVIDTLSGKDNKKERTAKGKELSDFKVNKQYIDACKVVKGLEPVHGFFTIDSAAVPSPKTLDPAPVQETSSKVEPAAKKQSKPAKKNESAGLSPAEKKELDQLKNDVICRKAQLKEQGMSGGQQNKDAQIVQWVNRMNELKEKESPGSTAKPDKTEKKKKMLTADTKKAVDTLRNEVEEYKGRLKTEFGYSNKEIKADPELKEMEAQLAALEK